MPRAASDKLPWAPFARFYGPADRGPFGRPWRCQQEVDVHLADVGELIGISHRSVARFVAEGIPEYRADQLAIALGVHPCAIWPDWYQRTAVAS